MHKKQSDEYIKKGIEILSKYGHERLQIMFVCKELNVTKGAFYNYFSSIDIFQKAIIDHFYAENTLKVLGEASREFTADEKQARLTELAMTLEYRTEVAFRIWGLYDPNVQKMISEMDEERLDFISKIYAEKGHSPIESKDIAILQYSAFIGAHFISADLQIEEKLRRAKLFSDKFMKDQD